MERGSCVPIQRGGSSLRRCRCRRLERDLLVSRSLLLGTDLLLALRFDLLRLLPVDLLLEVEFGRYTLICTDGMANVIKYKM